MSDSVTITLVHYSLRGLMPFADLPIDHRPADGPGPFGQIEAVARARGLVLHMAGIIQEYGACR